MTVEYTGDYWLASWRLGDRLYLSEGQTKREAEGGIWRMLARRFRCD